jgi:hypothetical protein
LAERRRGREVGGAEDGDGGRAGAQNEHNRSKIKTGTIIELVNLFTIQIASNTANLSFPDVLNRAVEASKQTGAISRLLAMDPQRPLEFRDNETVQSWSRSQKLEAGLGFVVGVENARPCSNRCAKNQGKFAACVSVGGEFSGACSSCHFQSDAVGCEYHSKLLYLSKTYEITLPFAKFLYSSRIWSFSFWSCSAYNPYHNYSCSGLSAAASLLSGPSSFFETS